MNRSEKVLLDSAVDLVAFYDILSGDLNQEINRLARDLEKCCVDNPRVEVVHSGSGFEGLSLPHLDGDSWNTDADHMLIRTDIEVFESTATGEEQSMKTVPSGTEAAVLSEAPDDAGPVLEVEGGENIHEENESVYIVYNGIGMHPGYVYVSPERLEQPVDTACAFQYCLKNTEFIDSCKGLIPLSNTAIMALEEDAVISGPSYSLPYAGSTFRVDRDFVYSLRCKFWPSQADEWRSRERPHFWPSTEMISAIVAGGCHIVPVGSHTSSSTLRELEWRLSFSVAEKMLVESLTKDQKLAYSILKALIKFEMKHRGIDVFASYHLKTSLLWFIELQGTTQWENRNLGENILELLEFLIGFYTRGTVPNYFVRKNDMIDHRSSEELMTACTVLSEMKVKLTLSLCRYIENSQSLPVFFDQSLTKLFGENPEKFIQVCKYNFLLMALANILFHLKKNEDLSSDSKADYLVKKSKLLHTKAKGCSNSSDSFPVFFGNISTGSLSANSVLSLLEDFLAADKLKVAESSAVILAVFNVFLALHPTTLGEVTGIKIVTTDFHKYLTNPEFKDCLFWAARLHERTCDAIYDFVVEKWKCGPSFHSEDEEAQRVMKLLMVVLGKPTKQATAVTGSLAKRHMEGQLFVVMRVLADYLLNVHPESAYTAFQASGYLMNRSTLSEILLIVNWGCYKPSKLQAVDLILSKSELQAQLTEKEFDKLIQIKHEIMS